MQGSCCARDSVSGDWWVVSVVSKLRIPHRRRDEILESSNMMSKGNRQRFTCHDHNAPRVLSKKKGQRRTMHKGQEKQCAITTSQARLERGLDILYNNNSTFAPSSPASCRAHQTRSIGPCPLHLKHLCFNQSKRAISSLLARLSRRALFYRRRA